MALSQAYRCIDDAARRKSRDGTLVVDSLVTVFFGNCRDGSVGGRQKKIDRLIPIVTETEQIVDRRNWFLKSRARTSDGSARRFFVVRRKSLRR
jgi:hypothetical protein